MAKKEKGEKLPAAFIDYETQKEVSRSELSATDIKRAWDKLIIMHHGANPEWGPKEWTLTRKLLEEYSGEELIEMINCWVQSEETVVAIKFGYMYAKRETLFDRTKPKDYGWD